MNTPIDYSSRYCFGHFCCRVKQGKRLSEFLQKYTDSGTETTHLAGYNILVFKYVNISAGLPLLSIGAIRERNSKIRYCIIWRCLHLMFTTTNVSEKWNKQVFLVLERYIGFEPRFEIINAVTDEPKGTIFSVISLIISTDKRCWTEQPPFTSWAGHLRVKLKRPLVWITGRLLYIHLSLKISGRKVWKIMVIKSLFFFLKDMKQSRLHIKHVEFRSSDELQFACG